VAQYSGIYTLSQASQAIKDNNWTGLPPQNVEFLVVAGGGAVRPCFGVAGRRFIASWVPSPLPLL